MQVDIIWNEMDGAQWQNKFLAVKRSTILQSEAYAHALYRVKAQKTRAGLIMIDGAEAGLVRIMEVGLCFNLIHAVILDRGPLWFEGFGSAAHVSAFFSALNTQFPKRFGRRRRIIPEIADGMAVGKILSQSGFIPLEGGQKYQTLWWDLADDEAARAKLKPNWRGALKKAEGAEIEIEWDDSGKFYQDFKLHYLMDRQEKNYAGVSPKLLDHLALFSARSRAMLIGKAKAQGRDIAAVMFLLHGQSATYQIGWSGAEGRQHNAHHLLLWQARAQLRSRGIKDMDLGGINDDAKGIAKFKSGTGGEMVTLAGQYR